MLSMSSLLILLTLVAGGEVVDSAASGFTVENRVRVAAKPAEAYAALVERVSDWWDPEHSWSGDAKNLSIEPRAGGCFCETLPGGGSVEHMEVAYVDPGELLRMRGALGPLQGMAVAGSMTFAFTEAEGATTITLTYTVGGYRPEGLESLAPVVDSVLNGQLSRLGRFIDAGRPQ
jgi:hypothetical protein